MNIKKKSTIFILDTSAILSGKPITLDNATLITTEGISNELKPGGRDYRNFQFLKEKGLTIHAPSKESMEKIAIVSKDTGDEKRLSYADNEILALALEMSQEHEEDVIILTDDYSIQNVAHALNINFKSISQDGITKSFKWTYRCSGCGKKFNENIKTCPICGALTKTTVSRKKNIKR